MSWYWYPISLYVVGFVLTFGFYFWMIVSTGGIITLGLAALWALLWPYHWLTGKPKGQPLPMD